MFDVGSGEVILILVVALLMFGGGLPEVGRSVGRSVAAFRRGLADTTGPLREVDADLRREIRGDDGDKA